MSEFTQNQPAVPTQALWTWSAPVAGQAPTVISYPTVPGAPTKSGLSPTDLANFLQIPIQQYGAPPKPIGNDVQIKWIRWAEDEIEQRTGVRLCQTWIAAPPAKDQLSTRAVNLVTSGAYQQLGVDYDVAEPPYDFFFPRAQDEGWMHQRLRFRPVKSVEVWDPTATIDVLNNRGVKNIAYIYPLLNEYFRVPQSWIVEDQQHGLIRLVPATNVQMLPLFAIQLAFMGFAESVPGGMWYQYTCGLTAADYQSNWAFMQELVLTMAAIRALAIMQLSVNFGATEMHTNIDGMAYRMRFSENGAFSGQIKRLEERAIVLLKQATHKVAGPAIGML